MTETGITIIVLVVAFGSAIIGVALFERYTGRQLDDRGGKVILVLVVTVVLQVGAMELAQPFYQAAAGRKKQEERLQAEKQAREYELNQKLQAIQAERIRREQRERERESNRASCYAEADRQYWNYIKKRGYRVGDKISAPTYEWKAADRLQKRLEAECDKQYEMAVEEPDRRITPQTGEGRR